MSEGHPKAPIGATCWTRSRENQYVKTIYGWQLVGEHKLEYTALPEWELDGLYWEQRREDRNFDRN